MHLHEPVAIFWDYENCALQATTSCYETIHKFRDIALQFGTIKLIKAYVRLSDTRSGKVTDLRSDLQACGVSLIDCPHNGRKDFADKVLLVDMMQFGWDNPAPATVILISGDRDLAYGISVLRLRHYRVVIMAQSSSIHDSLRCQASDFYDWDTVISGRRYSNGHFVKSGHRAPQMLSNLQIHSDMTSMSPPFSGTTESTPGPETSDNRHSGEPSPSLLATTSSRMSPSMSTSGSRTARASPLHSHASNTPAQHTEKRPGKGRDLWGSSGSPISPSTFVTALTPSDSVTPLSGNPGSLSHGKAVYTEEPCETSVEFLDSVHLRIISRTDHVGDMHSSRGNAQRAPSSLPIPASPRPTDSPVQRPATADPVMVSARNGAPPTDEPSESEDLEMSVQTLPDNHTTRPRVSLAPVSHASPHAGPRAVPPRFLPLVQVLDRLREAGAHKPLRSHVAIALTKMNSRVYDNAGVSRFKQYSDLAVQEGFVELGGTEGQAWISLLPHWHGLGSSELQ